MGRVRDSQRARVYAWEGQAFRGNAPSQRRLTLEECRALVQRVCEDYGVPVPTVRDGRGTRIARGGPWSINLPLWARTPRVVLHEVAHTLNMPHNPGTAAHGPEFARILVDLYARYLKVSARELRAAAKAARVKIATDPACLPPRVSREEERLRKEMEAAREEYRAALARFKEAEKRLTEYRVTRHRQRVTRRQPVTL